MSGKRAAETRAGTEGIWTFILIDMIVFGMIFAVYLSERIKDPVLFAASQIRLNAVLGSVNTLILLTSSWAMVGAVGAARAADAALCRRRLLQVNGLAAAFVLMKVLEYHEKYQVGIGPLHNSFFSLYYFMTGLHLMHLVGAMIFISAIRKDVGNPARPMAVSSIENVGLFWHFVDILWIFIFPYLYLVGLR
jgi:nitric oxide reductase NorE protein